MSPPDAELPETRERRCPACYSHEIAPIGHVTAGGGTIKVEHHCLPCGTAFWVARQSLI